MSNTNLHKAKQIKNDEFYTLYEDIEKELINYDKSNFENKIIYCPCDVGVNELCVPKSNFIKYFENNKERLGYKKLIHTSLQEDFDYRSEYCQKLFQETDLVVTNPPFSLFREFVSCLEKYQLKYLILGDKNAITFKEIFPLLKQNKLWLGYSIHSGERYFKIPNSKELSKGIGVRWFTNLDVSLRHEPIILTKSYNEIDYPNYDNYTAIEVSKTKDIPYDYNGIMGVPITFMDKYNPDQFELIGFSDAESPLRTKTYEDYIGYNQRGEKTERKGSTFGACPVLVKDDHKTVYYEKDGVRVQATYARIFIRRK